MGIRELSYDLYFTVIIGVTLIERANKIGFGETTEDDIEVSFILHKI